MKCVIVNKVDHLQMIYKSREMEAKQSLKFSESLWWTGGTTFFHEIRSVEEDAVSVSRLRSCGVILPGKANMHELGLGTTGNNPNYGYVMHRN